MFGVWPMARNTPLAGISLAPLSTVLLSRTPVTPSLSLPRTSSSVWFHSSWILGFASARSCMIMLARSLIAAVDHVHFGGVLRQVGGFFDGRVAAADDDQRLVAEPRQRAVADGTRADAAVLVGVLRRQAQVIRPSACGDDERVRFIRVAAERSHDERPALEVHFDDVVGDDARAEVERLLPHQLHELGAGDGVLAFVAVHVLQTARARWPIRETASSRRWKAGIVFDLGRKGELAERQRAVEGGFPR